MTNKKSIFDGFEFGDKFKTRDGRSAIFYSRSDNGSCLYFLVEGYGMLETASDGNRWLTDEYQEYDEDIVSRLEENCIKGKLYNDVIINAYNTKDAIRASENLTPGNVAHEKAYITQVLKAKEYLAQELLKDLGKWKGE